MQCNESETDHGYPDPEVRDLSTDVLFRTMTATISPDLLSPNLCLHYHAGELRVTFLCTVPRNRSQASFSGLIQPLSFASRTVIGFDPSVDSSSTATYGTSAMFHSVYLESSCLQAVQ